MVGFFTWSINICLINPQKKTLRRSKWCATKQNLKLWIPHWILQRIIRGKKCLRIHRCALDVPITFHIWTDCCSFFELITSCDVKASLLFFQTFSETDAGVILFHMINSLVLSLWTECSMCRVLFWIFRWFLLDVEPKGDFEIIYNLLNSELKFSDFRIFCMETGTYMCRLCNLSFYRRNIVFSWHIA